MLLSILSEISLDALVVRMAATTFVVVAVAWAVGVLGPLIGGTLAGFPAILGPGFYFLIKQAPVLFVSQAAAYSLFSMCAVQLFLLAYIMAARRKRIAISLGYAVATWLASALIFQLLPPQPWLGITLYIILTLICLHASVRCASPVLAVAHRAGVGLLVVRGLLAGGLVGVVTTLSHWLGPNGSGVLLGFPIGLVVVAVTIHQTYGSANVIATLRSALIGTSSVAGFCAVLALLLPHLAPDIALVAALLASVFITLALILKGRLSRARRAAKRQRCSPQSRP